MAGCTALLDFFQSGMLSQTSAAMTSSRNHADTDDTTSIDAMTDCNDSRTYSASKVFFVILMIQQALMIDIHNK